MKVLLVKTVAKLGVAGDVKEVKEGYAHNFLFKNKLAVPATQSAINAQQKKLSKRKHNSEVEKNRIKKIAKGVHGQKIVIKMKADEQGHLYAGISNKHIATALQEKGFTVKEKNVKSESTIKAVGKYSVPIHIDNKKLSITLVVERA